MGMEYDEAMARLNILVGQDLVPLAGEFSITLYTELGKLNKGWAGQTVERYLGIPLNSSRDPNLGSWELKVVPATIKPDLSIKIKETMAITMLDEEEVKRKPFEDSHLFTKLQKFIVVLREHQADNQRSTVLGCASFRLQGSKYFDEIKKDYEDIQEVLQKGDPSNPLTGRMGKWIQPRTKGPGGKSKKTRAFYARTNFLQEIFTTHAVDPEASCPKHAGKRNNGHRRMLDGVIMPLPKNQSHAGRHKCPYCAYEKGFRDGLLKAMT